MTELPYAEKISLRSFSLVFSTVYVCLRASAPLNISRGARTLRVFVAHVIFFNFLVICASRTCPNRRSRAAHPHITVFFCSLFYPFILYIFHVRSHLLLFWLATRVLYRGNFSHPRPSYYFRATRVLYRGFFLSYTYFSD